MGTYINPGNEGFRTSRNTRYVDKSGLIGLINGTLDTRHKLSCVSRPRRFGKSTAAQMLCAYYDRGCRSAGLFDDLAIAGDPSYRAHLNKYNVLYLDVTTQRSLAGSPEELVPYTGEALLCELRRDFPEARDAAALPDAMLAVVAATGSKFVAIIDEWDAPIRDTACTRAQQEEYLDFLRMLFKSSAHTDKIFAAAYMTGILPVKKDGTQSAISEFREYTMLMPRAFAPYVGFTEDEVRGLCAGQGADFAQMRRWYDGYSFPGVPSVYNPNSVMEALRNNSFESYWKQSSAAGSLLEYVNLDYGGLGKAVACLLGGVRLEVDVGGFENDTRTFTCRDDVLTLLVHFGYLSYDSGSGTVRIPNEEIRMEFARAVRQMTRADTVRRVQESDRLIMATAEMDEAAVAAQIEKVHNEEFVPLFYNGEQSLRSVVKLAYFAYRDKYVRLEELAGGTGYADMVYVPKPGSGMPALVVELKWNEAAEGAIAQIRARNYPAAVAALADGGTDILLVGISYRKDDAAKKHRCKIERLERGGQL